MKLTNHPDYDSRTVNNVLKHFINPRQFKSLINLANNSEECAFFTDKTMELFNLISEMPETYDTEGIEIKDKNVVLHYFKGSSDAWIVEKDMGDGTSDKRQHQAWGLMRLNGWEPETGYISIQELLDNGFELDFHWKEKTIGEIKSELRA